jgi:cysteine desulfurase
MPRVGVYLDYQASTPLDPRVREVLLEALDSPGNSSSEEHAFGWKAAGRVEAARAAIAQLIGASSEEIIFTSGATEANNIAVLGAAKAAPLKRRRILVSALEHKSVLAAADAAAAELGFAVELIPASAGGRIEPQALASRLSDDVAVVSVMAVNNEIGTMQPIAELGILARRAGAFFHVDATQALSAIDVDVEGWSADALSLSGHKIYGPGGIGALFLASHAPWRPVALTFGGGQEGGLRPGTVPSALCAALGEACQLITAEGAIERARIGALRDRFEGDLRRFVPDLQVSCGSSVRHPGCLHVRFPGVSASDLLMRLQPGVAASTGSACTSGVIGPSHVMGAIGLTAEEAAECVRFSLGRFSTNGDVEAAVGAIRSALIRLAA